MFTASSLVIGQNIDMRSICAQEVRAN